MRTTLLLLVFIQFNLSLLSQNWYRAYLNEDLSVGSEFVKAPLNVNEAKTSISQINGFPIAVPANLNFKNMRNLTLADINGDGVDDIVFATDNKLYVYTFQGLLWSQTLTGTAIYPPSVGDVDGDDYPDIVQVTGGVPANGRIYVFDRLGNTHSGWPVSFNNNWILAAPALADLNNNGKLEIIVNERLNPAGNLHILKHDGSSFNNNWPVALDGVPAVTPSVADIDNDAEPDIIICSTKSRYIFDLNGQPKTGFPFTTDPQQGYSYQSPIIADFDGDNLPEIIGATHGDLPQFYVMRGDNNDYSGWPMNVPDNNWTYSTPSVVKINNEWRIFMSRPIGTDSLDMLYGWDKNGNMLPHFPIVKPGGLEGYISVADITGDNNFELVFGSNLKDNNGEGFIHAYRMDGTGELPGFPLKPKGFTFMNGVCIGDVDGNGKTNLVALSYDLNFGTEPDSVYINAYELEVSYDKSKVLWGTYKGTNTRTGNYTHVVNTLNKLKNSDFAMTLYPNPASDILNLSIHAINKNPYEISVKNMMGQVLYTNTVKAEMGEMLHTLNVSNLPKGFYMVLITDNTGIITRNTFVKF